MEIHIYDQYNDTHHEIVVTEGMTITRGTFFDRHYDVLRLPICLLRSMVLDLNDDVTQRRLHKALQGHLSMMEDAKQIYKAVGKCYESHNTEKVILNNQIIFSLEWYYTGDETYNNMLISNKPIEKPKS